MNVAFPRMCCKVLSAFLWVAVACACGKEPSPSSPERCTGDRYGELHSPLITYENTKQHRTCWSCLYFGSYPANEVVNGAFDAVDGYALEDGDLITDAALYAKLQQAAWDGNDDTLIDGKRYHRINGAGAVTASGDHPQHYRWADLSAWHYFAYAPVKWRVLKISGTKALLLADRMPDTHPFHNTDEYTDWSRSNVRQWLNGAFLMRGFRESERAVILETSLENVPNSYFGTPSGPDTRDQVFLLSGKEVFDSQLAADYGFYPGSGIDDAARRFRSTLYAKCRGAWWSPVRGYRGNSFWLMRTSGYTPGTITYICDFGYIYNQGTGGTCDDAALLPAISIDLDRARFDLAQPVRSTDINPV